MGGCDLQVVCGRLGGDIVTDFARNAKSGAFMHVDHTEILRQARVGLSSDQGDVIDRLPFLDHTQPSINRSSPGNTTSSSTDVLMDYSQALYVHRATGLVVPWERSEADVTSPDNWAFVREKYGSCVGRSFLEWFSEEFEYRGPISPSAFVESICWLCGVLDDGVRVVFLNGAEVPVDSPEEPGLYERHRLMNLALEEAVGTLPNASICDVRKFVRSEDDLRVQESFATTDVIFTCRSPQNFGIAVPSNSIFAPGGRGKAGSGNGGNGRSSGSDRSSVERRGGSVRLGINSDVH